MYERILNLCEKENVNLLYFSCPIGCPEVFIYEMKARPNFPAKVISIFQFREMKRSFTRSLVMKDLIELPQVARIGISTMIVDNIILPETMRRAGITKDKIVFLNEPFNEPPEAFNSLTKSNCRNKLKIDPDEFVVLFSGSWNYIKGADIFVEALKYIDKDFRILIHKNREIETDPTLKTGLIDKALKEHPKIIIIEKWIPRGEMAPLYVASDVVACAHRRLYEYSLSGITGMASEAKRPVVVPDFYFFNEIVKRYKTGVTYIPEDPLDLALAINYTKNNYNNIMKEAKFEESIKDYFEITNTPLKIIGTI
jgi:glycosyltransferase involved in cell wall biosynthesis